ncbi:MAG: hypothetical protein K8U03_24840 [Planctomycetia bacterium]|nr:hypothetical protein [Planctomycetia bacterium]
MNRREFCLTTLAGVAALGGSETVFGAEAGKSVAAAEGELLYNGIRLPAAWPPTGSNSTLHLPSTPPYLTSPPAVIKIDVGRQLFVDDFLIEKSTLTRTFHRPDYHPSGPVVRPDQPWERQGDFPMAAVFSDGVWYDPKDRLFKMWYMGGYRACTCYAVSQDGIVWEKPKLDIQAGTNIVSTGDRDSAIVWLDHEEPDPARRYKLFRAHREVIDGRGNWFFQIHVSADGIHWGDVVARSASIYPRSTVFRNPFRKRWEYGIRKDSSTQVGRCRRYFECDDAVGQAEWDPKDRSWWLGADTLDIPREDTKFPPQLTNLDGVAYESLILGLFTLYRGTAPEASGRPELNDVCLGFSRDGFHFARPDRRPFLPMSETKGDWNWGNVQSAGGGCLVVGDKLHFYCSGRSGTPENREAGGSTGLATLRRDGFASLDAGAEEASVTTRPMTFTGKHLFVNVDAPKGELRAELLDERGAPLMPFAAADCLATSVDSTTHRIAWKSTDDLSPLVGKPVRFRFTLKNGRLFAFWVSPDTTGASRGYAAAGGPGTTQPA